VDQSRSRILGAEEIFGEFLMKKIYILLTRSTTLVSRTVHFVTKAPYTHVSLCLDDKMRMLYSSSRKNGRTIFPAGPCIERLDYGFWDKHPETPCILHEIEVSDEAYERIREEIQGILDRQEHHHFNIIGLFLCYFDIAWARERHFFCSQFVSEMLRRSDALELPKHPTLMRPMDYARLERLRCVYEGDLRGLRERFMQRHCNTPSGLEF
jgi:hypothetical protein